VSGEYGRLRARPLAVGFVTAGALCLVHFSGEHPRTGGKNGDADAPKCVSCHGSVHDVKGASETGSTIAAKQLAETCAKCHSDAGFLSRHRNSCGPPGGIVSAERARAHDCRGKRQGSELQQLSWKSRHISGAGCALACEPLASGGDLRAMPQRNCEDLGVLEQALQNKASETVQLRFFRPPRRTPSE
jgi:hypothetical protein